MMTLFMNIKVKIKLPVQIVMNQMKIKIIVIKILAIIKYKWMKIIPINHMTNKNIYKKKNIHYKMLLILKNNNKWKF